MKKSLYKKSLILGIIILFVGAGALPSIGGIQKNLFLEPNNEIPKQNIEDISSMNQVERWALLLDIADEIAMRAKSMKTVLCRNGWQEDHIKIVGGDNIKTKDIIDNLSWLATHSSSDDIVLIFLCAHGYYFKFFLNDDEFIYYWTLNKQLNKIKTQGMTVVLNTCYSGSALPFLQKKNRVVITACKWNELAVSYDARFNIALQGFSDFEGNNDNFASAEELFKYTLEDERGIGDPQIRDNYPGELILTLVNEDFVDSKNIDIYHNHPYDGDCFVSISETRAQSFKPLDDKITKIKLLLRHIYTNESLVVSIRENLNGIDLTSKIITADTFSDCEEWVQRFFEIDLPDISVTPGRTYYIVCKCNSPQNYYLSTDNWEKDEYYDGKLYYSYNDQTWYTRPNEDLIFIVYGEDINNDLPNKPDKPYGTKRIKPGKNYTYSTIATDPNGDQVYYMWDWGDGNKSEWFGPFKSGETVYANYSWLNKGYYEIKVKVRDVHGMRSDWSDPLYVTMPKNKHYKYNFPLLNWLFERFPNALSILKFLLRLQ